MRMLTFAKRCTKEILRDPMNLVFGLGFPVVLLLLISTIQANIPVSLFEIEQLAPGVAVFGFSFMTLFSATLVAKDRESAFLQRLYTTPLNASDFIVGYMAPMIPMAVGQSVVCYLIAVVLGLPMSVHILVAVLMGIPVSIFYISLGLLCGSIFQVKAVGGLCGGLLTNLSGWLSGVWFDLKLVGGMFEKIADVLPFVHAVEMERALLKGEYEKAWPHFYPVLIYAVVTTVAAIWCFLKQMKKQS